jgi:outer membrane protein TolC
MTQAQGNILQLLDETADSKIKLEATWPWKSKIGSLKIKKIKQATYAPMMRPRTKALRFDYEREVENSKGNRSLFIPQIDLTYTWSRQEITKNINPFLVGFNQSDQTALLSFSFPLFNQYKDVATYKRQKARLATIHGQLIEAKREDFSQWISIKERLIKALYTVKSRIETLSLGKRIYQTSYKRFRAGRATVNDLAIDQNRLFQSENLANDGMAQFHLLLTEYCHLQGKLIEECIRN